MGDKNGDWKMRRDCPFFSGKQEEFKSWRGRVEDWLIVCKKEVEFPGLEMRMNLGGRAWEVTEDLDRDKLKGSGGEKFILEALDKIYKKDNLMENYEKMKKYFKVKRESGEDMKNYIIRYEKCARECSRMTSGIEMFEGEAKAFHVLEQANLTDQQKQLVLSACGKDNLEYETIVKIMRRIFEGIESDSREEDWLENSRGHKGAYSSSSRGVYSGPARGVYSGSSRGAFGGYRGRGTERGSWNGRGGVRNPVNREGKTTTCIICQSEWHWAYDCPKNFKNRDKDYKEKNRDGDDGKKEKIYISGVTMEEEEEWGDIEAILDTGCKSTVCGEL